VCSIELTLKRTEVYGYRLCESDAKDLHNRRFWARLIDNVIFNGTSLIIGFGLGSAYGTGAINLEALGTLSLAAGVVVAALALTMDSWFDGCSIGKRAKGLTVITLENKRAGLGDSIKRNAIFLVGWIHVAASLIASVLATVEPWSFPSTGLAQTDC